MKKQFVTYEIALALKKLDFVEPCMGLYYIGNKKFFKTNYSHSNIVKSNDYIIDAPLWQQVIDWFDFKNITIDINSEECDDGDSGDGPMFVYFIQDWRELKRYSLSTQYLTRHEACEQAILKAIELCKE